MSHYISNIQFRITWMVFYVDLAVDNVKRYRYFLPGNLYINVRIDSHIILDGTQNCTIGIESAGNLHCVPKGNSKHPHRSIPAYLAI